MAVIKAVSSKAGIGHAIDYVTKKEKTEEKLVSGLHCEPETVKEEMQATKELWGKTDGRTYKHYVQSYHEDEKITPEQAHKNAVELAEHTKAWKGHEVLIATHIDKGHIHTHFIVNSVNYENGHKLQWSKYDLKDLKERCNEQSREQAGEKACKIRDNKLEKYYNMDFGKESMEHEFERNARTAEAELSKRAASRVKPTEPDRAGKQSAQRSVGDVERELRGIDEAVKSRTSKGRAEQAERRRAEQEAHQRAEAERRAAEEQQRIASRRYIGRDWEFER